MTEPSIADRSKLQKILIKIEFELEYGWIYSAYTRQ